MTVPRFVAICIILVLATIAWFVLGGTVYSRTYTSEDAIREDVGDIWGQPQAQQVPKFVPVGQAPSVLHVASSDVTADIALDQRRKGLMWYATYAVDFAATYRVESSAAADVQTQMRFAFPDPNGVYDGFAVVVDGTEVPVSYDEDTARATFTIPAGSSATVKTGYKANGLDEWRYVAAPEGVDVIDDFSLTVTTDFADIDFPGGTVSPSEKERTAEGWRLVWRYDSLVSGRPIAVTMPVPPNPGPLAARITFFAPVSLLFFFASMVLLTVTAQVRVHPVNYGFLAAAFFAFHLLFAYLVDHIDINLAFAISSVTSVALCLVYLRLVLGAHRALLEVAASQVIFLVLFSYSFFFEGFTGLAVTIGSVLTLAYFMVRTAHVDWAEAFRRTSPRRPADGGWSQLQQQPPQPAPAGQPLSPTP